MVLQLPVGIAIFASNATLLSWNAQADNISGYTLEAMRTSTVHQLFILSDAIEQILRKARNGIPTLSECLYIRRADGEHIPVSVQTGVVGCSTASRGPRRGHSTRSDICWGNNFYADAAAGNCDADSRRPEVEKRVLVRRVIKPLLVSRRGRPSLQNETPPSQYKKQRLGYHSCSTKKVRPNCCWLKKTSLVSYWRRSRQTPS
jgi:PAS domain S-box-containing protein